MLSDPRPCPSCPPVCCTCYFSFLCRLCSAVFTACAKIQADRHAVACLSETTGLHRGIDHLSLMMTPGCRKGAWKIKEIPFIKRAGDKSGHAAPCLCVLNSCTVSQCMEIFIQDWSSVYHGKECKYGTEKQAMQIKCVES